MGLGWSEVQILSPRPILQLHRAGPPTGSGLDVDLGCCGAWPEGKPRESRACPPWPVTARRAPRCVNPPTVRPRGLQPTGRPADNLFKRKPPPPCPFALAGASAPAFFLAVQRRGGAHRHPRGTEGASALLTGRSTPWRARSAHERVEPVPCAPCPAPPGHGQPSTALATSIRFLSGSRMYTERIGPTAPVRWTGPVMTGTPHAPRWRITSSRGAEVRKHKSAEPGVGLCAAGANSLPRAW